MQLKNIRFSLSIRLIVGVVLIAAVIYFLTIRYINYDYENVAVEAAKEQTNIQAEQIANELKNMFDADFDLFRTYAQVFEEFNQFDSSSHRKFFNKALEKALLETPRYYSVWDSWELKFVKSGWYKTHGRVSYAYYRNGSFVSETVDTLDVWSDDTASMYYGLKTRPREAVVEPYNYKFSNSNETVLMTSIIVPVMKDSVFMGMVGADISLTYLKELIDSISTNFDGYAYILSKSGNIVAHPDPEKVGKNIKSVDSLQNEEFKIIEELRHERVNSFVKYNQTDASYYYSVIVPVNFGQSDNCWGIAINKPLNKIMSEARSHFDESRKVGYYGLLALVFVILLIAWQIIRPIKKITYVLNKLSMGEIEGIDKIRINTGDEIEQMGSSVNTVLEGFRKTVIFSNHIKSGDFDEEFHPLSEEDVLGNAILEMRNSLKQANEDEKSRKEEDRQSNWTSQGINLFGNILRQDNNKLGVLAMRIISTLVDYMNVHQGGLYMVQKEKSGQYLELIASIGFESTKMQHKTIMPNEGPVGRCLLEKEPVYMDDIPTDYPPVLSGLGQTQPRSSLIVPMMINEDVVGIIEIGALRPLKTYEIEFVDKIAVSIASTISSAKINVRTAELLEQSKEQADALAQQEEEMRQNMEELQAMQEEATKRELKIQTFIDAAKNSMLYVEYDIEGKIVDINNNMLFLFQLSRDQVLGKRNGYYEFSTGNQNSYEKLWANLKKGQMVENVFYSKHGGRDYYLKEYYYPLLNEAGKPFKVVNIAFDITEEKRKEIQLAKLKEEYSKIKETVVEHKRKVKTITTINEVLDKGQHFEYVDLSHLRKVYKDDLRKIQNIVGIYIDTIPRQIDELKANSEELNVLRSKVNSFKTKMSYLGLTKIVEIAKEIENNCATGIDIDSIEDLIEEIEQMWLSAVLELKSIIEGADL